MALTRPEVTASKDYTPDTGACAAASTGHALPIPLTIRVWHSSGQKMRHAGVRRRPGDGMIAAAEIREQTVRTAGA